MKTTSKKRTWALVAAFVFAISLVTTAANMRWGHEYSEVPLQTEESIELESWMTDPNYLNDVIEEDVQLEPWMTDPKYLDPVL